MKYFLSLSSQSAIAPAMTAIHTSALFGSTFFLDISYLLSALSARAFFFLVHTGTISAAQNAMKHAMAVSVYLQSDSARSAHAIRPYRLTAATSSLTAMLIPMTHMSISYQSMTTRAYETSRLSVKTLLEPASSSEKDRYSGLHSLNSKVSLPSTTILISFGGAC